MSRRSVLGVVLLIAGACCFVLIWRSIGWMVHGGLRDYLQLAGLLASLLAAMYGLWLLADETIERILRRRARGDGPTPGGARASREPAPLAE